MTIVFDARCVGPELSGIGRYTLGLLSGLAELGPTQRICVVGGRTDLVSNAIGGARRIEHFPCDWPVWSVRGQLLLPRMLGRLGCTVYHCPYLYGPLMTGRAARIVTIHDLIPNRRPDLLRRAWKVRLAPLWNTWFRAQCAAADAVVTVSDFSARELQKFCHLSSERIHRIYNGVRSDGKACAQESVRKRFSLDGPIVLYIGRHDPYKNIENLVRAFQEVSRSGAANARLVIAGKLDPRYPAARQLAQSLGLADRVIFTDYIEDDVRLALLRASRVFVFPSRYEGFGLPPLEAMAEGVPVVSSNATSLPEVLGDAALLVSPDDALAMARAILSVLHDDALADRLRAAGRARAAQFTWRACAAQHLRLYDSLARRGRPTVIDETLEGP